MAVATMGFAFYTAAEYFAELTQRISEASDGDRLVLATMTLRPERPEVKRVMDELREAARRGADVKMLVDAKQFLLPGSETSVGVVPGPLFFNGELPLKLKGPFRAILEMLDELQDAGGQYAIINQPGRRFTNPIAGRSHLKFAIINSRVYTGGCNLDTNQHIDMMAGWDDRRTADWLCSLAEKMIARGSVRLALDAQDVTWAIDHETSLLVDAGVRGQSLIFEKALELIDGASERITTSSQFFPNDVTALHLLAAHKRGVQIEIYYNHPRQFGWPHNLLHYSVVGRARSSLPQRFFEHAQRRNFLHAKVLVTEQAAMIGSHNFVRVGTKLGTAEITLLSYDLEFARQVLATLERQVRGDA
jgi:PLD-like domain